MVVTMISHQCPKLKTKIGLYGHFSINLPKYFSVLVTLVTKDEW